jgi:hypothetical protein
LPAELRFSSRILNINSEIRDAATAVAVLFKTIELRDNRDRLGAVDSIDLIGDMTEKEQRTAQILARTRSVKSRLRHRRASALQALQSQSPLHCCIAAIDPAGPMENPSSFVVTKLTSVSHRATLFHVGD